MLGHGCSSVQVRMGDQFDDALCARVDESWERYAQDPTPENHAAYRRALLTFADWIMRGKLPEDFQPLTIKHRMILIHRDVLDRGRTPSREQ
jgi:hypothetical protein